MVGTNLECGLKNGVRSDMLVVIQMMFGGLLEQYRGEVGHDGDQLHATLNNIEPDYIKVWEIGR